MKILFDTNIILDVLLDRSPFSTWALDLFQAVEQKKIQGFIGAATVTTIHHFATKTLGSSKAHKAIQKLLSLFDVAPVNAAVLKEALELKFHDYEDAVLYAAAHHAKLNAIVTRDIKGFKQATLDIYSPKELLVLLNQ